MLFEGGHAPERGQRQAARAPPGAAARRARSARRLVFAGSDETTLLVLFGFGEVALLVEGREGAVLLPAGELTDDLLGAPGVPAGVRPLLNTADELDLFALLTVLEVRAPHPDLLIASELALVVFLPVLMEAGEVAVADPAAVFDLFLLSPTRVVAHG